MTVDVEDSHDTLLVGEISGFSKLHLTTGNHEIIKSLADLAIKPEKLEW